MSHPDDGTIQALLDGELDAAERTRLEAHLDGCGPCAARVTEARAFQSEADRLVELLTVPQSSVTRRVSSGRRTVIRTLAWAASILLAVAVGYWSRGTDVGQPVVLQEGERAGGARVAAPATTPTTAQAPPAAVPPAAARPAKPESAETSAAKGRPAAPQAAPQELTDARANEVAAKAVRQADEPVAAWRVISMEEGVRLLGGQIRLIDGLTPERVETGPGTAVPGADPALPLVRVIYASGSVTLDQQRPAAALAARREADASVAGAAAANSLTAWQEREGIRFVITGSVSADSLRALGARVR